MRWHDRISHPTFCSADCISPAHALPILRNSSASGEAPTRYRNSAGGRCARLPFDLSFKSACRNISQRYTGLFRCTTRSSRNRICCGTERQRLTSKCTEISQPSDLRKRVFVLVERAQILSKLLGAVKLVQQGPRLLRAARVWLWLVQPAQIVCDSLAQLVPRLVNSFKFRKFGREKSIVEDRKRDAAVKDRIAKVTV